MFIFDWIAIPFGYAMDFLYRITNNYGVAVILFSVLVALIMHPMNLKSAINSYKKRRLAPYVTTIRSMYPNNLDMQNRMMEHMYRDEKVSITGGCLLSVVPVIILISMFCVLYSPLRFIYHLDVDTAAELTEHMKSIAPDLFSNSRGYAELIAAQNISHYAEQIKALMPDLPGRVYQGINFNFLGINLAAAPQLDFTKWADHSWGTIGLFCLPIVTALVQTIPSIVEYIKKIIAVFKNKDVKSAAKSPSTWMTPVSILITLVVAFMVPGALSLYWLTKSLVHFALNEHIRWAIKKLPPDKTNLKELERISAEELAAEKGEDKQDDKGETEYAE